MPSTRHGFTDDKRKEKFLHICKMLSEGHGPVKITFHCKVLLGQFDALTILKMLWNSGLSLPEFYNAVLEDRVDSVTGTVRTKTKQEGDGQETGEHRNLDSSVKEDGDNYETARG